MANPYEPGDDPYQDALNEQIRKQMEQDLNPVSTAPPPAPSPATEPRPPGINPIGAWGGSHPLPPVTPPASTAPLPPVSGIGPGGGPQGWRWDDSYQAFVPATYAPGTNITNPAHIWTPPSDYLKGAPPVGGTYGTQHWSTPEGPAANPTPTGPAAPAGSYGAMPGFDTDRLRNIQELDPKYLFGRAIQNLGVANAPTSENLDRVVAELIRQGLKVKRQGDVLSFDTGNQFGQDVPQDVIRDIGGPNAQWQFLNAGGGAGGGTPTPTGPASTPLPAIPQGTDPNAAVRAALRAGIPQEQIDQFLQNNPGDYGRILEALGPGVGGRGVTQASANSVPSSSNGQDQATDALLAYLQRQDQQKQSFNDQIRNSLMQLISRNSGPLDYNSILSTPEVGAFQRVNERAVQRFRAQAAEDRAQRGQGTNQFGETSGALAGDIGTANTELQERLAANESQIVARELQSRRDQLMQALSLGAGVLTADQQQQLQRELQNTQVALQRELGQGQLGLGLLEQLLLMQRFGTTNQYNYDVLGLNAGQYAADQNRLATTELYR